MGVPHGTFCEERRLRGDNTLSGEWNQVNVWLCSQGKRTRGISLRLHEGRVRLDIRRTFSMERVLRHWKGLPRVVLESPLEVFKEQLNVALSAWG